MASLDYIDQELFDLTKDFTLEQWEIIRNNDFWATRDSISSRHKKQIYVLQMVKEYLYE